MKANKQRQPKRLKRATALKYDPTKNNAPQLVASGEGYLAEKIINIAESEGVFVYHDPDLARVLSRLNLYQEIPEELYKTVAEVLAFIQMLGDKKNAEG